jgi:D-alanine-D-alanine ligase-like ATP-grasp enzyme
MGLQFCGVDIMCPDAEQVLSETHWIIEVNGAPRLDNYAAIGVKQNDRVEKLYVKVLEFIGQNIAV